MDEEALLTLVRLLKLSQPISKGQLQRLFHNLCANSQASRAAGRDRLSTRAETCAEAAMHSKGRP